MYTNWSIQRHWCLFARRLSSVAESAPPPPSEPPPTSARPPPPPSGPPPTSARPLPPPRIKRGPTDILRALAATVGHDPTAAHYKYHDDPYLIPQSNFRKRSYALAHEAGRKAAAWVRDEHAEWFTTREFDPPTKKKTEYYNAEPRIPAYAPKPLYTEKSKVTIEDLRYVIDNALVEDSVKIFRLLGGVTAVDRELAQSLLELLSFYKESEPDSLEWLEERWFAASTGRERHAATWKTGGLAEEIFNSLKPKDARAYCAIIQGMAKYHQAERAYQLSREALEARVPLTAEAYNRLLGCVGYLREGVELRVQALVQLLEEMQQQGLKATSETLNSCLRSVAAWGGGRQLRQLALQLVAEFRSNGIDPSLTAYYHLLCLFCKENGPRTDILSSVLTDLESRPTLQVVEPSDTKFFITAMSVCSEHLQDMALADRVHALLMRGDNYKLLGDAYKESIYYRHLVTVACKHAPLERTLQFLDQLVPNVYVPEPSVMDEIIKALEVGGEGARLAEAWSQLVMFGHARRTRLVEQLAAALASCYPHQNEEDKAKMRAAAKQMLYFGDEQEEQQDKRDMRIPQPKLSAAAMTHVVALCSEAAASDDEWAAAAEAARRLACGEAAGVPADVEPLVAFAERAVRRGRLSDAPLALRYLAECGLPQAGGACVAALAAALNRPADEAELLLREPVSRLQEMLQPQLMAIVQVHRMCEAGATGDTAEPRQSNRASPSSDSDSDSDSELD